MLLLTLPVASAIFGAVLLVSAPHSRKWSAQVSRLGVSPCSLGGRSAASPSRAGQRVLAVSRHLDVDLSASIQAKIANRRSQACAQYGVSRALASSRRPRRGGGASRRR